MAYVLKKNIFYLLLLTMLSSLIMGCTDDGTEKSLINNPAIEDVRNAISSIDHISLIEIVTEENDPNGNLGKDGSYTGALFFLYDLVEGNTETSALEAGTDGGGSIEVYANAEDAKKRNDYLSAFDGTIFASGSHVALGTLVIRTSNELTASQQDTLEAAIINALNN
ncbi:hypothetical protein HF295_04945 [Hujiaoplasma nucleasis]|uniref:Uncharacterized protein n=1 Tax=Hujiaoplasma nucleasis TaxID=2725268 RepID=A0A7L6N252_9MOLU|nr:hypothetical protein [Hujiaoplasma nucleasis]QLY40243.1 hypothetical protein HF295_04945 [Hujiaoplasma nucleasis]